MIIIKIFNNIFNLFCNLFFKNKLNMGSKNIFCYPFFAVTNNKNITIGNECVLNCFLVTEGKGNIKIGSNSSIGKDSSIRSSNSIEIGDHVQISSEVIVLDNNSHSLNYLERRGDVNNPGNSYMVAKSAPIKIGNDVLIGRRSIILKGVSIGDRSIIGAGSVVVKNIPEDVVACGNPAVIVKYLNKNEDK